MYVVNIRIKPPGFVLVVFFMGIIVFTVIDNSLTHIAQIYLPGFEESLFYTFCKCSSNRYKIYLVDKHRIFVSCHWYWNKQNISNQSNRLDSSKSDIRNQEQHVKETTANIVDYKKTKAGLYNTCEWEFTVSVLKASILVMCGLNNTQGRIGIKDRSTDGDINRKTNLNRVVSGSWRPLWSKVWRHHQVAKQTSLTMWSE